MSGASIGGLCGKARRQSKRSRASRLYDQKFVDEYFEPDGMGPGIKRHVPIGRRSEFLPSVVSSLAPDLFAASGEGIAEEPAAQFDPALGGGDYQGDRAVSFGVSASTETVEPPAVLLVKRPSTRAERPSTIDRPSDTKSSYTFGGFMLGCAMGSAVAVMMLMVMQAVVG